MPVAAMAAGPGDLARGEHGQRRFEALDSNKDGALSAEELAAGRAVLLKRMDPDGDGFVSREEFTNRRPDPRALERMRERREAVFKRLDTDGDGRISAAELDAAAPVFATLDRNGDGKITPDEMRRRPHRPANP
jgi:Ca2+-binding EF-hand superfamily protein